MAFQGPAVPATYSQPRNESPYPGTQLCPQEIRLLQLHPGDHGQPLHADLIITEIREADSKLSYEALSYTWGHWTRKQTITLNDVPGFHITDNLYNGLQRLRLRHHARLLWVDALCIDQSSLAERNVQLRVIGRVYASANRVVVWLGDATESQTTIKDYVVQFCKRPGDFTCAEKRSLAGALLGTTPSWWDRTWVVQEFALAAKEPLILYGQYSTRYNDFERKIEASFKWKNRYREMKVMAYLQRGKALMSTLLNTLLHSLQPDPSASGITTCARQVLYPFTPGLRSARQYFNRSTTQIDLDALDPLFDSLVHRMQAFGSYGSTLASCLADIAWRLRDLTATDAHDKVFALLSLMRPATARLLQPDYNTSVAIVYSLATYASLREGVQHSREACTDPTEAMEQMVKRNSAAERTAQYGIEAGHLQPLTLVTFGRDRPLSERPDWGGGVQDRTPGLPSWAIDFAFPRAARNSLDPWHLYQPGMQGLALAHMADAVQISPDHKRLRIRIRGDLGGVTRTVKYPSKLVLDKREFSAFISDIQALLSSLSRRWPYAATYASLNPPSSESPRPTELDFQTRTIERERLLANTQVLRYAFEIWDREVWRQKCKEECYVSTHEEALRLLVAGKELVPKKLLTVRESWNPRNPAYSNLTSHYLDFTYFTSGGSTVFVLDDGFLGIANRYVRDGDRIVEVGDEGRPCFMVLRPVGECFRFLGFALVHGFMRGEADELRRAGMTSTLVTDEIELV